MTPTLLELSQVSKSFQSPEGDKIQILNNVSLSFREGEQVALVGPSGSGKSTLLSLMGCLELPDSGDIHFQNRSLVSMTESQRSAFRSRFLGFIFQSFYLVPHYTALENVGIAAEISGKSEVKKRAREALEKVGLAHRINHRPTELSGGEQQRVAIARALVVRPKLILCDEPTGNLDPKNAEMIMSLIRTVQRELASLLVVVTHDHAMVQSFDRVIRIDQGEVK